MKKAIVISLFTLSGLSATSAIAAIDLDTSRFECPKIAGGTPSESLTNYGSYIRGIAEANTGSNKALIIFHGKGVGVPLDLSASGYGNAGTQYTPSSGRITCFYSSNQQNAPAFNVSYKSSHAKGGWIVKSENNRITIKVMGSLSSN